MLSAHPCNVGRAPQTHRAGAQGGTGQSSAHLHHWHQVTGLEKGEEAALGDLPELIGVLGWYL